jgi:ribosome-associated protein
LDRELLKSELTFKALRSSGSGGQHVNKVSSKVELHFNLENSNVLTNSQKLLLLKRLKTKLTNNNELILQCDESRSQHKNKELVIDRFLKIIEKGLIVPKKRKPTKIPKSAIRKRLKSKRIRSEKKAERKKPDLD